MDKNTFAESIKSKYPEYANVDNTVLADKMLAKYPEYQSKVTVTEPKKSFLSKTKSLAGAIGGAIVKPFDDIGNTLLSNAGAAGQTLAEKARGVEPVQTYSEKVEQAGTGRRGQLSTILSGQRTRAADLSTVKGVRQTAGNAIEAGSTFLPVGKLAQGGKFLKSAVKVGAEGAKTGAVYGVGNELASDKEDITTGGVVANSATNAAFGGLAAFGLGVAGKTIAKTAGKAGELVTKTGDELKQDGIMSGLTRTKERLKTVNANIKKNSFSIKEADGTTRKISPMDTFTEYGWEPKVSLKGDISTEHILANIDDKLTSNSDLIDTTLIDNNRNISIEDFRKNIERSIKNDETLADQGLIESTLGKLDTYIKDLRNTYGNEVPLTRINNIRKVVNQKYNPDTTDLFRKVGDSAREIVYNATDDQAVRQLLTEQRKLIKAGDFATKLNGHKVEGGRLGNMFATGLGAVLGQAADIKPLGLPIGPIIGGGLLRGAQAVRQQMTFKSARGSIKKGLENVMGKNLTVIPERIRANTPEPVLRAVDNFGEYMNREGGPTKLDEVRQNFNEMPNKKGGFISSIREVTPPEINSKDLEAMSRETADFKNQNPYQPVDSNLTEAENYYKSKDSRPNPDYKKEIAEFIESQPKVLTYKQELAIRDDFSKNPMAVKDSAERARLREDVIGEFEPVDINTPVAFHWTDSKNAESLVKNGWNHKLTKVDSENPNQWWISASQYPESGGAYGDTLIALYPKKGQLYKVGPYETSSGWKESPKNKTLDIAGSNAGIETEILSPEKFEYRVIDPNTINKNFSGYQNLKRI